MSLTKSERTQQHFLTIVHDMTPEDLDVLIMNGFDVNGKVVVDGITMSPLGAACFLKVHPNSVDTLLCHGADIEIGTESLSPLEILVAYPAEGVNRILNMRGSAKTLVIFGADIKFNDELHKDFAESIATLFD
jgi:hypothetical protein